MGELQVVKLSKHYGDNPVVQEISFTVQEGEFFVLLGPSGGGKSTLLRLLCGIEAADSGQVFLSGREITKAPPRERNIGMVFQDYGLYPHMNVYQNIAYGLEARGMSKDEVDKRVKASSEKLGIANYLPRIIVDLSGGEQQRVALARALAKDADLYLFDEPLSNLDPKLRSQARRDIQMVHREKHRPSIYVTHDQTEAVAMGDRIAIIAKGHLQQVGTPDEILDHPANAFVARFMGTPPMNLIEAALSYSTAKAVYQVDTSGMSIALPKNWNDILGNYKKEKILIGLRPNSFGIANSDDHAISGKVTDVEPLIGESVYTLQVSDGLSLSVVFSDLEGPLVPGAVAHLNTDADAVNLFDIQSGQSLEIAER